MDTYLEKLEFTLNDDRDQNSHIISKRALSLMKYIDSSNNSIYSQMKYIEI